MSLTDNKHFGLMNYSIFGNRLRILRINNSLTQENMADILDMSQSAYSKIERGERKVSIEHLRKVCNHFNLRFEEITSYCQGYMTLPEVLQIMEDKKSTYSTNTKVQP